MTFLKRRPESTRPCAPRWRGETLAWVQSRLGVASTISGARTLAQLEDNLAGLNMRTSSVGDFCGGTKRGSRGGPGRPLHKPRSWR